jgi:hypothetical protein
MKPYHYFTRPNNMSYHNLCSPSAAPPGLASLLGMGLKFCIESPRPNQRIGTSLRRFQRSVRLHFHFKNENDDDTDDINSTNTDPDANIRYIPSLYLPST